MRLCLLAVGTLLTVSSYAQTSEEKPTRKSCLLFNAQFNGDQPILDYAKRFGTCAKIGSSIYRKSTKNYIVGVRMDFIFGNSIKEDSMTWNLYNKSGNMIDNNGIQRNPGLFQRGYQVGVDLGKIFDVWQVNPNSGVIWLSSYGFMQYRINMYDQDNGFAQFAGEYEKGYDRLTNGLYTEQMLGYTYLSKSKAVNVTAGLTFCYASTGGRRTWLYDVNRSGLDKRQDGTVGFKFIWHVPKYKKIVEDTYY
ncbi:MAG: hypothetical protein RL660_380 [Bacteroidota bacterium]|jgi:hypothetical protein